MQQSCTRSKGLNPIGLTAQVLRQAYGWDRPILYRRYLPRPLTDVMTAEFCQHRRNAEIGNTGAHVVHGDEALRLGRRLVVLAPISGGLRPAPAEARQPVREAVKLCRVIGERRWRRQRARHRL